MLFSLFLYLTTANNDDNANIDFWRWVFERNQLFTIFTVIASGLISWVISAIYFRKTNRNSLRQSVIFPFIRKLDETMSYEIYKELETLSKVFETRYLTTKEQRIIHNLLEKYKKFCNYKRSSSYARCLFSYFCNKLEENGIDINISPNYVEDEIIAYSIPYDLLFLEDDIERIIANQPPEYDFEESIETIEKQIEKIFVFYCKKEFDIDGGNFDFFKNTSVYEIYIKSEEKAEWDNALLEYKSAKEHFLEMKICK